MYLEMAYWLFTLPHIFIRRALAYGLVLIGLFGPPLALYNLIDGFLPEGWVYVSRAILILLLALWLVVVWLSPIGGMLNFLGEKTQHPADRTRGLWVDF